MNRRKKQAAMSDAEYKYKHVCKSMIRNEEGRQHKVRAAQSDSLSCASSDIAFHSTGNSAASVPAARYIPTGLYVPTAKTASDMLATATTSDTRDVDQDVQNLRQQQQISSSLHQTCSEQSLSGAEILWKQNLTSINCISRAPGSADAAQTCDKALAASTNLAARAQKPASTTQETKECAASGAEGVESTVIRSKGLYTNCVKLNAATQDISVNASLYSPAHAAIAAASSSVAAPAAFPPSNSRACHETTVISLAPAKPTTTPASFDITGRDAIASVSSPAAVLDDAAKASLLSIPPGRNDERDDSGVCRYHEAGVPNVAQEEWQNVVQHGIGPTAAASNARLEAAPQVSPREKRACLSAATSEEGRRRTKTASAAEARATAAAGPEGRPLQKREREEKEESMEEAAQTLILNRGSLRQESFSNKTAENGEATAATHTAAVTQQHCQRGSPPRNQQQPLLSRDNINISVSTPACASTTYPSAGGFDLNRRVNRADPPPTAASVHNSLFAASGAARARPGVAASSAAAQQRQNFAAMEAHSSYSCHPPAGAIAYGTGPPSTRTRCPSAPSATIATYTSPASSNPHLHVAAPPSTVITSTSAVAPAYTTVGTSHVGAPGVVAACGNFSVSSHAAATPSYAAPSGVQSRATTCPNSVYIPPANAYSTGGGCGYPIVPPAGPSSSFSSSSATPFSSSAATTASLARAEALNLYYLNHAAAQNWDTRVTSSAAAYDWTAIYNVYSHWYNEALSAAMLQQQQQLRLRQQQQQQQQQQALVAAAAAASTQKQQQLVEEIRQLLRKEAAQPPQVPEQMRWHSTNGNTWNSSNTARLGTTTSNVRGGDRGPLTTCIGTDLTSSGARQSSASTRQSSISARQSCISSSVNVRSSPGSSMNQGNISHVSWSSNAVDTCTSGTNSSNSTCVAPPGAAGMAKKKRRRKRRCNNANSAVQRSERKNNEQEEEEEAEEDSEEDDSSDDDYVAEPWRRRSRGRGRGGREAAAGKSRTARCYNSGVRRRRGGKRSSSNSETSSSRERVSRQRGKRQRRGEEQGSEEPEADRIIETCPPERQQKQQLKHKDRATRKRRVDRGRVEEEEEWENEGRGCPGRTKVRTRRKRRKRSRSGGSVDKQEEEEVGQERKEDEAPSRDGDGEEVQYMRRRRRIRREGVKRSLSGFRGVARGGKYRGSHGEGSRRREEDQFNDQHKEEEEEEGEKDQEEEEFDKTANEIREEEGKQRDVHIGEERATKESKETPEICSGGDTLLSRGEQICVQQDTVRIGGDQDTSKTREEEKEVGEREVEIRKGLGRKAAETNEKLLQGWYRTAPIRECRHMGGSSVKKSTGDLETRKTHESEGNDTEYEEKISDREVVPATRGAVWAASSASAVVAVAAAENIEAAAKEEEGPAARAGNADKRFPSASSPVEETATAKRDRTAPAAGTPETGAGKPTGQVTQEVAVSTSTAAGAPTPGRIHEKKQHESVTGVILEVQYR